jgi:hypothetical protein
MGQFGDVVSQANAVPELDCVWSCDEQELQLQGGKEMGRTTSSRHATFGRDCDWRSHTNSQVGLSSQVGSSCVQQSSCSFDSRHENSRWVSGRVDREQATCRLPMTRDPRERWPNQPCRGVSTSSRFHSALEVVDRGSRKNSGRPARNPFAANPFVRCAGVFGSDRIRPPKHVGHGIEGTPLGRCGRHAERSAKR